MGRKATGRNSRMTRVPNDMNMCRVRVLYYDILPKLQEYQRLADSHKSTEPRWEKMIRMFEDLNLTGLDNFFPD
jgi:hypothetical protein